MIIGRFEKHESGFLGSLETLAIRVNPVRFIRQEKGANYSLRGPDDGELGAAWRKSGEWGDYLSVKLDCPTLLAPINATMKLSAADDGFYLLRWNRRNGKGNSESE